MLRILPVFGLLLLIGLARFQPAKTPGFKDSFCGLIKVESNTTRTSAFSLIQIDTSLQKQIPVLCYHYIKKNISKGSLYVIPETVFEQQMRMLLDSGYETILPDQIYLSVTEGSKLPAKPVMLSFDDTHEEDYLNVFPILNRLGLKAVFFINTVVIGKPGYMTSMQIKELSDSGHTIGGHTWNHPNIKKLRERDLTWQIDKPKQDIEKITGKPVEHFAYPYGVWNDAGISKLKKHGIKTAFQFSGNQNKKQPLHTIRRLIVSGNWSETDLFRQIDSTFFAVKDE
jgi:peptidoglycan/xylan/chitin deacetylase (PgdA/CDA1 family)